MSATRIVVFAKAPLPGRVKTRLIPVLGADGAAALARRLLDNTLQQALAAGVGPVELCGSPAPGDTDWAGWQPPPGVECSDQGDGDLGARMARAADRTLERGERALLIGTDCPALSAARLATAAGCLDDHDACLHPTLDGGYVLLGLRVFAASLFRDIPWSTPVVATRTQTRMAALGWRVWVGDVLRDIDTLRDLVHLPRQLHQAVLFAPNREKRHA